MRLLISLARKYPWQSVIMLLALLLAGIAEGIGLSALLPLVSTAVGSQAGSVPGASASGSGLEKTVTETLSALGLTPTLGILLVVFVLAILLKNGLVLLANNIRDIIHDRDKGILTLAIVLGRRKGLLLYATLVVLAYLGIVLMSIIGPLYLWSLIVLLSMPLAFRLVHQMRQQVPADADARTAQLDTAFGVLLVISLVLEGVF